MRSILAIYNQYHILKNIQEHQLRVAGVAALICDQLITSPQLSPLKGGALNRNEVITACLLHDMGNIVKVDVGNALFPEALEPEGSQFWQGIKEEFQSKYGADDHFAGVAIAKELGMSKRVVELIRLIGFLEARGNAHSENFDQKICAYADMRVGPWGVVGLEDRFTDLRKRYQGERADVPPQEVLEFEEALRTIEQQIFSKIDVDPTEVNDAAIEKYKNELENWQITK